MARIGIDATGIQAFGKGISRYQKNLIRALNQLDLAHEFFVFHRSFVDRDLVIDRPNWHFIQVSFQISSIWEQFQLLWLARKYSLDLIHTTSDRLPFLSSVPFVIHLFELPTYRIAYARQVRYQARWYQRFSETYNLAVFPYSLKKAAKILTSSAFTKQDLTEQFQIPERKIKVVYAAHEQDFRPAPSPEAITRIRARMSGGNPYILHFSSGDPRENTQVVLKAFQKAKAQLPFDVRLILVGAHGRRLERVPLDTEVNGSITRLSYIPDRELIELYQGASLYVDPSLYEGFGLQLLEAMACGVPVIASNVTAIPEMIQEAGVLIEPNDFNGVAEAIAKVLTDSHLQNKLRQMGLERSLYFNWEKTAQQVSESFEEALNDVKQ